ncbi:MAG TPA: SirA family protein [Chloroflexi bacterium]|nr:SirA family protein [Chloroflexota bacterium]
MTEIDLRGLSCPIPVVKTQKSMADHPGEALVALVDTEVSKENVSRLAKSRGYSVTVNKTERGDYRLQLMPARED